MTGAPYNFCLTTYVQRITCVRFTFGIGLYPARQNRPAGRLLLAVDDSLPLIER